MASITKKRISGKVYYYAVECQRVEGKPKIVSQVYLGKVEDIITKVTEPPQPQSVRVREFGITAALLNIVEKLGLVQLIDNVVVKRAQGASVGQYLLVASINRCSSPTSKSKIGEWYQETILPRILKVDPKYFTSQRFWDNMDLIEPEELDAIQHELAKRVAERYGIDLSVLLYDATNFFTYIDTNTSCGLPQRGRNKQKRNDLRQIGMALLVTRDGGIPLLHQLYQGNQPDCIEFDQFLRDLIDKFMGVFSDYDDITLVCDKGNNSEDNLKLVDHGPFHFVSSLVPSRHQDLLNIPLDDYQQCRHPRLAEELYYRTKKDVFGAERTIICVFNTELFQGQIQGIMNNLLKTNRELLELKQGLLRRKDKSVKGRRPTVVSVEKHVQKIVSRQYIKEIIQWTVQEIEGNIELEYRVDQQALEHLKSTLLGKTILFTDREDWESEQIILAYRDQYEIEHAFRQMKDPSWASWYPQFHWTDQKIMVHGFYCFLALLLSKLLKRELTHNNLSISLPAAMEKLSKIEEVTIAYIKKRGHEEPQTVVMLSEMGKDQKQIYEALNLERFR